MGRRQPDPAVTTDSQPSGPLPIARQGPVEPRFARAVRGAASSSATPFSTLMAIANAESGRRPGAVNGRSSAAGAFQFTEQTWLELVHRHGQRLDAGDLAAQIAYRAGRYEAASPEWRDAILRRRHDTTFAAHLAAAYCDECRLTLSRFLGRQATEAEVLVAFLLGHRAASRLITAAETRPDIPVSRLVPRALAFNPELLTEHERPVTAHRALALLTSRYAAEIAAAEGAARPQPADVARRYSRAAGLGERGR